MVGNAPEFLHSHLYVGCVVCVRCVCALCIDTHPCVVCISAHSHACVLHVSCVVCMLSSLCVPMSHAYDWMHTSMSLCVHICRHVSMCVYVYMYVLYPLVHPFGILGSPGPCTFHDSQSLGLVLLALCTSSLDLSHLVLSAVHICVSHRPWALCYCWT